MPLSSHTLSLDIVIYFWLLILVNVSNSLFHANSSLKETGLYDGITYSGIYMFMFAFVFFKMVLLSFTRTLTFIPSQLLSFLLHGNVDELVTLLASINPLSNYTFMPLVIFRPFTCKRHSCALLDYIPHESTKNVWRFFLTFDFDCLYFYCCYYCKS